MNNLSSDNTDKISIFKIINDRLCDLIAKLSKDDFSRNENENEIKDVANAFNELYLNNDFRHQYSSITRYIIKDLNSSGESNCLAKDFSSVVNTLNILSGNLNYLYSKYINAYDEQVKLSYIKLCDHINLEIVRFNYFQTQFDALQKEFKTVESACNDLKEQKDKVGLIIKDFNNIKSDVDQKQTSQKSDIEKIVNDLEESKEQLKKHTTWYISILGIFAGIIITIFSAVTFSTSVLSNIKELNNFTLTFWILIIFAGFINILYSLYNLVYKVTDQDHKITKWYQNYFNISILVLCVICIVLHSCSSRSSNVSSDKLTSQIDVNVNANQLVLKAIQEKMDNK